MHMDINRCLQGYEKLCFPSGWLRKWITSENDCWGCTALSYKCRRSDGSGMWWSCSTSGSSSAHVQQILSSDLKLDQAHSSVLLPTGRQQEKLPSQLETSLIATWKRTRLIIGEPRKFVSNSCNV